MAENGHLECVCRGTQRTPDRIPGVAGIARGLYGPSDPLVYREQIGRIGLI